MRRDGQTIWQALPQEQQDKFHKAIKKVKDTLLEMMSWEKMKPDLIQLMQVEEKLIHLLLLKTKHQ